LAREPRGAFVLAILLACAAGALAGLLSREGDRFGIEMSAQHLVRVSGGQMVLVLLEKNGSRRLGVPVTLAEAALIQGALFNGDALGVRTVAALGGRVVRAAIDDAKSVRDFRAHLVVKSGGREQALETSAGQALSVALQTGAAIVVDPALLEAAGVSLDELRGKRAASVHRESPPAPVDGI